MTVYTAGTTTPAFIYSDAALTTRLSNPTTGADKSDASGRFPQIFAATGSLFDILQKDASGVTLKSYVSVPSQGVSTATLGLDFTSSRTQFRGSGGVSYWEAGDAAGDDIGGSLSIGGWNGTQADEIELQAVVVSVNGRFKEQMFKIPGTVRQEAVTFTGVASVAIPLTNEPSGVRLFDIDILDLVLSALGTAPASLSITFSYDGGSTYIATGYEWSINGNYVTTAVRGGTTYIAVDTAGHIADAMASTGGHPGMIRMSVQTSGGGTAAIGQVAGEVYVGGRYSGAFTVNCNTSGRATHMKLTTSAATMAGIYRVVPQRGLGET